MLLNIRNIELRMNLKILNLTLDTVFVCPGHTSGPAGIDAAPLGPRAQLLAKASSETVRNVRTVMRPKIEFYAQNLKKQSNVRLFSLPNVNSMFSHCSHQTLLDVVHS